VEAEVLKFASYFGEGLTIFLGDFVTDREDHAVFCLVFHDSAYLKQHPHGLSARNTVRLYKRVRQVISCFFGFDDLVELGYFLNLLKSQERF